MSRIVIALVLAAVACGESEPAKAAPPRDPNVLWDDGSTRIMRVIDGNVRCYAARGFGGDVHMQCVVLP